MYFLGDFDSLPSLLVVTFTALLSIYLVTCLLGRKKIDIKGKFVLITGCDTGFGRETAIKLDKMGACVLATCLTKEGEQSLKSEASDRLKTFQMDVTNSKQIKDVYEEIKTAISHGKIIKKECEETLKKSKLVFCKYFFCNLSRQSGKAEIILEFYRSYVRVGPTSDRGVLFRFPRPSNKSILQKKASSLHFLDNRGNSSNFWERRSHSGILLKLRNIRVRLFLFNFANSPKSDNGYMSHLIGGYVRLQAEN